MYKQYCKYNIIHIKIYNCIFFLKFLDAVIAMEKQKMERHQNELDVEMRLVDNSDSDIVKSNHL